MVGRVIAQFRELGLHDGMIDDDDIMNGMKAF